MFAFTDENQIQRIKKNFKAIRLALGYKTILDFAQALDKDLKYPGLAHRTIEHYEAPNDSHPITREAVMAYSRVSGIQFERIVNDDIEKDYPRDFLADKESFKPSESIEDDGFINDMKSLMDSMFPFFSSKAALKDKNFALAFLMMKKRYKKEGLSPGEVEFALKNFLKTSYPESYLNVLCLLGLRYCSTGFPSKIAMEDMLSVSQNEYDSLLEYLLALDKKRDLNHYELGQLKNAFLEDYGDILVSRMNLKLYDNPDHKEYVYFYLALRYKLGMMDNSICKMTDQEMFVFGDDLIHSLYAMKNKYAKRFTLVVNKKD